MAEAKSVTKKVSKVKMFGTGNFQIEDALYVFRDGEEVDVKKESHRPILEAESKRREAIKLKTERITAAMKEV